MLNTAIVTSKKLSLAGGILLVIKAEIKSAWNCRGGDVCEK